MTNIIRNHLGTKFDQITLDEALIKIKNDIEYAIRQNGEKGKNNLIRSQLPINLIHNVIKSEFIRLQVEASLINPDYKYLKRLTNPRSRFSKNATVLPDKELNLHGYLKSKRQDISIIPSNIPVTEEVLNFPTSLNNTIDVFGSAFTERILSVNVRSQLSSVMKNFDTLYERTFAESLNLHLRFNRMVLGEVYLIILNEYDSVAARQNRVSFNRSQYIEKYILAFQALNGRNNIENELYKYEKIALIAVDLSTDIPKVYHTTQELIEDGFLPQNTNACINELAIGNFVPKLLEIYRDRFPNNSFN